VKYTYVREIQGGENVLVENDHRGAYRQLFKRTGEKETAIKKSVIKVASEYIDKP